jgi:autotransporter translocation and assembly factor TamB
LIKNYILLFINQKFCLLLENGASQRLPISVQFDTLGFRLIASGDLTNDELEEALESLNQQNQLYITQSLQRLKLISTTLQKFSFTKVKKCLDSNQEVEHKSEKLKNTIHNYFELDKPFENISITLEVSIKFKHK